MSYRTLRTFVGFPLSDAQRRAAQRLLAECEPRSDRAVRWVGPAKWHVTVAFIGEVPVEIVPELCRLLDVVTQSAQPFEWSLEGLGAFPNLQRPRVLWMGVQDTERKILHLRNRLLPVLEEVGVGKNDLRAFRPHVTIARTQSPWRIGADLLRRIQQHQAWAGGSAQVAEIELLASQAGSGASAYPVLGRFPLQGDAWGASESSEP